MSIQVVGYETSHSDKIALVLRGVDQPVKKGKSLILCVDKSGSMQMMMKADGEEDENSWANASPSSSPSPSQYPSSLSSPYPSPRRPVRQMLRATTTTVTTTPFIHSHSHSPIHPQSRLGCVYGFLVRILDMYEYIRSTQGLLQELTIILFDDQSSIFSTLDGLSYLDMKEKINISLLENGGTNFEDPLCAVEEYRKKSSSEVDVIFLSDGGHCESGKMTREMVQQTFAKKVDLAIGIGEGKEDFDQETLTAISHQFVIGSDSRRIRDLVVDRVLGLVSMLGRNITLRGTGILSTNLLRDENDEDENKYEEEYKWPEMSMLMELYVIAKKDARLTLSYIVQNGNHVILPLVFSNDDDMIGDIAYGDKIEFAMTVLSQLEQSKSEIAEMSLKSKAEYLQRIKKLIDESGKMENFRDTRIGLYVRQLYSQLEKMILSRDENHFLDLAKNVKTDAYRRTSSTSATSYFSPSTSHHTSAFSSSSTSVNVNESPTIRGVSSSATYNSKCVICMGDHAHREVIYIPCGHFMTCSGCSVEWNLQKKSCPYCNQNVTGCVFVNLSEEQQQNSWNMKCGVCKKRQVEIVSEECKHAFSCKQCMIRARHKIELDKKNEKNDDDNDNDKNKKCVQCTICQGDVKKYLKVFM